MIKLFEPHVGKNEEIIVKNILKSGFWASGAGTNKVLEFEKKFQKFIGCDSCVAVNSGTAALHLSLNLLNIKNKEVIIPSMSFASTANAVLYNGGIPKFVEINPKTLCIDPKKIKQAITKKTKVILPVHFGGMSCNLSEIQKIAKKNNLILVEDAAHAVGTKYNQKNIGTHGKFVCFSFHPVKNLAMPTGGIIAINDKNHLKLKKLLNSLRWCGISNRKNTTYDISELGWNYYMNEFSAAIGIEQLSKLNKLNKRRKEIAKKYFKKLKVTEKSIFDPSCSYHLYWILVPNRDKFMKLMSKDNIETGTHYKPLHKMKLYNSKTNLPITENISKKIVTIPVHPNLTNVDIDKIINTVNKNLSLL